MAEEPEDRYDVFISYSQADEGWVQEELIPRLESAGIRSIDQYQFELGRPELYEIERAITGSRRTLLILSPDYLESNWGEFDSFLVSSFGRNLGEWRAIPVIIRRCELPPRLSALVREDLSMADDTAWARFVRRLSPRSREHDRARPRAQSAADQARLSHLRQLLTTHFGTDELEALCSAVGVIYDELSGDGKSNKARHLVDEMGGLGRIPELVAACAERRPHVSWEAGPEAIGDSEGGVRYSPSVGTGLSALAELMRQSTELRTAVVAFRTDFRAASQQIDALGEYKHVHDLLHRLQFDCYNLIVAEAMRPEDNLSVDNLMDYEIKLEEMINDLQAATEHPALIPIDMSWIQDLVKARETLAEAIQKSSARPLRRARWLLGRVLAKQPVVINVRLNAAAGALRLPSLVAAMACVSDNLARLDLDAGKVEAFETGVDSLMGLNDSLAALVREHDRWQAVDAELRRIEGSMGQDTMEIEMSWPDLKAMVKPLLNGCRDRWAESIRQERDHLDRAIADEDPPAIRLRFRCYRSRAGIRFYHVDASLKRLCEDLRQIGGPLALVMGGWDE